MKDERLYLIHIAECIEKIEKYTTEGKAVFLRDTKTQDAVIRNFEIIGEAVKRLSETMRKLVPQVPWRLFAGFRDVLIHQYSGVDLSEVWLTRAVAGTPRMSRSAIPNNPKKDNITDMKR